jgi:hypothetical protein
MDANEKSILFAGGKLIRFDASKPTVADEGIKLERNETDKNWTLTLKAVISSADANDVILKYSDLGLVDGKIPASNMPFIEGLDQTGNSVCIKLGDNSTIAPTFYRDNVDGILNIKLNVPMGKTQNSKTQNATVGSPD